MWPTCNLWRHQLLCLNLRCKWNQRIGLWFNGDWKPEKKKIWKSKQFWKNIHIKESLRIEFAACYKASWCQSKHWHHLLYLWRILLLCGSGIVRPILTSQSRSRTEYLIVTNCIIVFDWYHNLTNKPYLTNRLTNSGNFVVVYFLGHPVGYNYVAILTVDVFW